MAKIISIANHKGGCGKTTSSINIGAALASMGYDTLLVDLDPQANLTLSLGASTRTEAGNVYTSLMNGTPMRPLPVSEHLELVPSCTDLVGAELELAAAKGRENRLKEALAPMMGKYSFIIVDCPPALGLLTINALAASSALYVPLQAQYLALQGLAMLDNVIGMVRQSLNRELELAGVFLTQYDSRKVLHRNVAELAAQQYPRIICQTSIRDNVALAEAPAMCQTIFQYAPRSKGAEDYTALAKEILNRSK